MPWRLMERRLIELTSRCCNPTGCPFLQGQFCEDDRCATESDEVKLPCSVTEHEKRLRTLGCILTGAKPPTLHHARGGSMAVSLFGTPGVGQKQNHALQIPLARALHVGQQGIDCRINGGVETWEKKWMPQVRLLSLSSRQLQYNQHALAWRWASPLVRVRVERFLQQSRCRFHPA